MSHFPLDRGTKVISLSESVSHTRPSHTMGQLWAPVNIDKRERYSCWGKVGEFLFWTQPQSLFFHLLRLTVEISSRGSEGADTR